MSFGFATVINISRDARIALHSRARAFITPEKLRARFLFPYGTIALHYRENAMPTGNVAFVTSRAQHE